LSLPTCAAAGLPPLPPRQAAAAPVVPRIAEPVAHGLPAGSWTVAARLLSDDLALGDWTKRPGPRTRPELRRCVVGATGFEPVTPSVSGHARPFARSAAALHGTTSALLTRVTESGTAVRCEAAYGIAADKLLTVGRELHRIWRTSVRAGRPMADRCSFCGSSAGPFSRVEGLFTVLMCADCQAARGHGSGPTR
jgi:hypothetical protein